jgi:fosfomycin resistance protein FosX
MIEGLSHVTFVVRDLDQMANFLKIIFEAEEIYCSGDNLFSIAREKFFEIGNIWIVAMEGVALSNKTYNHLAFKIAESEFEDYVKRFESLDVKILEGRSRWNT